MTPTEQATAKARRLAERARTRTGRCDRCGAPGAGIRALCTSCRDLDDQGKLFHPDNTLDFDR